MGMVKIKQDGWAAPQLEFTQAFDSLEDAAVASRAILDLQENGWEPRTITKWEKCDQPLQDQRGDTLGLSDNTVCVLAEALFDLDRGNKIGVVNFVSHMLNTGLKEALDFCRANVGGFY